MSVTSIQWTDRTWNVTRGCTRVSEGCRHCYAERQAHRFSGPGQPYQGLTKLTSKGHVWTGDVEFVPKMLAEPLGWKKPQRVFVNSMSDLFHEDFTNEQIAAVFGVMAACQQHTFQVLTKRPARMLEWFRALPSEAWHANVFVKACAREHAVWREQLHHWAMVWPLPNVWLGVSVEDQQRADERIPLLLQCPAAVRFVSAEPLLGPVDLDPYLGVVSVEQPEPPVKLDWVIAGGESGPGARPCCLSWLRNIVHDCEEAGVACFIKQLGARPYEANREVDDEVDQWAVGEWLKLADRKGGDMSQWPGTYLNVRQFPGVSHG